MTVGEAGRGADPPVASGSPSPPGVGGLAGRPPRLLIFAVTVTGILNNSLLGPVLPDIIDDFDRGAAAAGLLVAAGSLPGVVVAPLIGLAADRYGRRVVLVPCLSTFGAFGVAAAAAPTFELMVAARLLQGFGTAGLINLAVVLISDHWDGVERTALIGRNAAVLTLGLALAPAISGVVAGAAGWRTSLALYSVGVPMALLVWRLLPADRRHEAESIGAQLRAARTAIANPVVVASLGTGVLVFIMIFGAFLTAFPIHLEEEFGLDASARGLLISVPALSSSVVAFNLGRLRSHLPLRTMLVGAALCYAVAFGTIGVAGSVAVVAAASTLYGLGEGVFIPSLQDAVADASPPERRGAVIAVWVGAARFGQTLGPLLAGAALGLTSTAGVFWLAAALAGATLVLQAVGPIGRPAAVAEDGTGAVGVPDKA